MRSRFFAFSLGAMLMAGLLGPATSIASEVPRIPQSRAEWEAMSSPQQAAVMAYLRQELESRLADGTAEIHEVSRSVTEVVTAPQSCAVLGFDSVTSITVTYNCYVRWTTIPGSGDWVQGGGYTDASNTITEIYASRLAKKGQFLRDGTLKYNWYAEYWPGSHAENWSQSDFAFWWEYVHWVTKGWHGAYNNGVWLLGPDRYCYAETWL